MNSSSILKYEGSNFFRQRLILSCLSGKAIRITEIRSKTDEPGLQGWYRFSLGFK